MSAARSRSRPARQARARSVDSSVCSRLRGVGVDAGQRQHARRVPPARSASASVSSARAGGGAANELRIETGRPARAAGRVDRELRRVAQPRDARAVLAPSARPFAQLLRLGRRRTRPATGPARRASSSSIQGRNSCGGQLRERQQQVAEIALGIDGDDRDAVDRRLLDQRRGRARSCRCRSCRRIPRGSPGRASRTGRLVESPAAPR